MFRFSIIFLIAFSQLTLAQNALQFKSYASFNEIKDLWETPTTVYAAAENAIFTKTVGAGTIKTLTTIDGISGQTITALYHSENFKKTIIGYQNGLIISVNDADGKITKIVDIINKAIPSTVKRVNHFMEFDGVIYVSADFGISQFFPATSLFGDTYFIGNNGQQISINQTAVFDGFIYASTAAFGIRRATVDNPNLIDFSQWTEVAPFGWSGIETFGDKLVAVTNTGNLQRFNGTAFTSFGVLPQSPVDFRHVGDQLIVTTASQVYIYNANLAATTTVQASQIPDVAVQFTCATIVGNSIFIGTNQNGVFQTQIDNPNSFENISPDGPVINNVFAINAQPSSLYAVYGDYEVSYNPYTPVLKQFGVSHYVGNKWKYIPPSELFGAKALVRIAVNPTKPKEIYVSSYQFGLLKIVDDVPEKLFNETNSTLQSIVPNQSVVRINGLAFDKIGSLWATNSLVKTALKQLPAGATDFVSYNLETVISNVNSFDLGRLAIDKNGTKWMSTRKDGVIGFNEAYGNLAKNLLMDPDRGNLPNNDVRVVTPDNRNALWIGTRVGLRVVSSVDSFLSNDQITSEPIIILDEGLAQELLFEQFIIDIVVDGANNKWIGTADSGVFMVSPNGQETFYHFTTDNSPLPSNTINDVDIDPSTGEVFFATTKGMVSFKGVSTAANEDLNNVVIFPNPVRPNYLGTVKISGLLDKANVKITDIQGNLVYETKSAGGTIEWDTTAFGKYKVASGVYMVFISAADGVETKVKKVMVVR